MSYSVQPIDGSPPGSPIPGILQAGILEWVAISFSNAWKWKVKVKPLSHVQLLATPRTAAYKAPPMGFFQARVLEWVAIAFSSMNIYFSIKSIFLWSIEKCIWEKKQKCITLTESKIYVVTHCSRKTWRKHRSSKTQFTKQTHRNPLWITKQNQVLLVWHENGQKSSAIFLVVDPHFRK